MTGHHVKVIDLVRPTPVGRRRGYRARCMEPDCVWRGPERRDRQRAVEDADTHRREGCGDAA